MPELQEETATVIETKAPTFLEDTSTLREIKTLGEDGPRYIEVLEANIRRPTIRTVPLGFWVVTSEGMVMAFSPARAGKGFKEQRASINALGRAASNREVVGEKIRTWILADPEDRGEVPTVDILPEEFMEAFASAAVSMLAPNYGADLAEKMVEEDGVIDMVILDELIAIATGAAPGYRVQVKSKNPEAP